MVLDAAVLEDDASLQTHSIADDDVGADGDVWTNAAVFANLCRWVDQDVAAVDEGLGCWCEQLGVLAGKG